MATDRPLISIGSPIAIGFSVMGMFAATLIPIWGQAALFFFGVLAFIGGGVRAAWYLRSIWGKSMIGVLLMLVISIVLLGGGALLGWLSVQGLKGAFQPPKPTSSAPPALTPQTIAGAFVEAIDIIRERNSTQDQNPINLIPVPQPSSSSRRTKKRSLAAPVETKVVNSDSGVSNYSNTKDVSSSVIPSVNTIAVPIISPYQAPAPRHLSDAQRKILLSDLASLVDDNVQSSLIYTVNSDNESYQFATDIEGVFSRAGLHPQMSFQEPNKGQTGVFVETFSNSPSGLAEKVMKMMRRAGIEAKIIERTSVGPTVPIVVFVSHQEY